MLILFNQPCRLVLTSQYMTPGEQELFIEMRNTLKDLRTLLRNHDCKRKGLLGKYRYCATCNIRKYIKQLLSRSRYPRH